MSKSIHTINKEEAYTGSTPVTMMNPITGQAVAPRSWNHGYPEDQIKNQNLVPIPKKR